MVRKSAVCQRRECHGHRGLRQVPTISCTPKEAPAMHRVSRRAFPRGERRLLVVRRARGHVDAGLRLRGHVLGIWDVDRESSHDLRSSAALDLARSRESDGRSRQSCLDICDSEVCAEVAHWAPFPASREAWLLGVSWGIADQG